MMDDDAVSGLVQSTRYIYRGANLDTLNEMLSTGTIEGDTHSIYTASLDDIPESVGHRESFEDLPFYDVEDTTADVTGGLTDSLPETRRFRDTDGLVAVIDGRQTPFQKVHYDYDWMDANPGVLAHILTTVDGELRIRGEGLYGALDRTPLAGGGYKWIIEHWGQEELPATSEQSMFADESEWVALESPADISRGLEGIVSFQSGLSKREAADEYARLSDALATARSLSYLLVLDGRREPDSAPYTADDLAFAHDGVDFLDPDEVPVKYRGGA